MRCEDQERGSEKGYWMRLTMFQVVEKVTAGENKARKRKATRVQNKLKKRAESQPYGARCVGRCHLSPHLSFIHSIANGGPTNSIP